MMAMKPNIGPTVALLTGGGDRPYAHGLAQSLIARNIEFDFIGSDFLESEELRSNPLVHFLNLRGDMTPEATAAQKIGRVFRYYIRLIKYAAKSPAPIFHILWNNKFEYLDRTILMLYYRCLGKRVVLTIHNVNARKRDNNDSVLNRATLWCQYRLCQHIFVHTGKMKQELQGDFGINGHAVSVIPFGINETISHTGLTQDHARKRFGLSASDKVMLFFGNIAPYKGLEFLVEAMPRVRAEIPDIRLIIAGRPKGNLEYWNAIQVRIDELGLSDRVIIKAEYIPDEDTEAYFLAADVLVLPYTFVFQSGVLFLGYNFGLPVIAADVGSLREDIVEGKTGFVFAAKDPDALASVVERYFESDLFRNLDRQRAEIREFARERYSWDTVASITMEVYERLFCAKGKERNAYSSGNSEDLQVAAPGDCTRSGSDDRPIPK